FAVNDFVVSFFPTVADVGFTAQLEDGLDAVARGEQGWQALLSDFYRPFRSALDVAGRAAATFVERPAAAPSGRAASAGRPGTRSAAPAARAPRRRRAPPPDPLTGKTVARGARRPLPADAVRPAGEHCPLCGRPMVERKGPYSTFLGCSGFPECRGTVKLETRVSARPGKSRSRRRSPGR
ncbi:MAG TPA: topoisomerase DNA-binding C4 zinc finger domain-containing protein, partial [Chloroflexota bacterium]